ncbi:MAG TPA: polysaccharide biosynthesis/export family protein [Kiritimatiellia bacterium]|jgi:polysaccharide export outer membrane protein
MIRPRHILNVLAALALVAATGCSSVQKRMGGTASTSAKPAGSQPRMSASASGLKISTNAVAPVPAAPAATKATPAAAPAKPPAPAAAKTTTPQASAAPLAAEVGTEGRAAYRLRPGDSVVIFLRGIMPKDDEIQDIVDESGHLNLPYIGVVLAAGRTTSQLEQDIQKQYLDKEIYKNISVSVVLPAQYFFVRGEVKLGGRFPLVPGTTLLQAVAAAGGYNDFADPKGVYIIRGEKKIQVNARDLERHPEKDITLEPGDVIVIPRSLF